MSQSPIWTPPDVELQRQIETAQGHLANAQAELDKAFVAAAACGDASKIPYWREQVATWQAAVDALTR